MTKSTEGQDDDLAPIGVLTWLVILFMAAIAVLVWSGSSARAIDPVSGVPSGACPADRPVQIRETAFPTCTLLYCLGELSCPTDGASCFRMGAGTCNVCAPQVTISCITQDEHDAASGVKKGKQR